MLRATLPMGRRLHGLDCAFDTDSFWRVGSQQTLWLGIYNALWTVWRESGCVKHVSRPSLDSEQPARISLDIAVHPQLRDSPGKSYEQSTPSGLDTTIRLHSGCMLPPRANQHAMHRTPAGLLRRLSSRPGLDRAAFQIVTPLR